MRVGFAGTPEFAARALAALHDGGHTIPLVLTQPDRPSGRGMIPTASPVKRYAQAHGLPLMQPPGLRDAGVQAQLRGIDLDVLVVPIGGGGLISGMALAAKALKPGIEVIGVETQRFPSMYCALKDSLWTPSFIRKRSQ